MNEVQRMANRWTGVCVTMLCCLMSSCKGPPRATLTGTVVRGPGSPSFSCSPTSPDSAIVPFCEAFELTKAHPMVVTPGAKVALTGKHFRPAMTIAAIGGSTGSGTPVTVSSDTAASLVVPPDAPFGPVDLTLTQDGVTQRLTLFSNGGKTDHPIFTAGADQICRGLSFYDTSGVLQEGQKDCAIGAPPCSENGEVGCVTTPAYKAADLSNLVPGHIKNNVTIAGVAGTYPSTTTPLSADVGLTDLTVVGPTTPPGSYQFFDKSGSVRTLTVSDAGGTIVPGASHQVFGAVGTLFRGFTVAGTGTGPANCAANGQQNCLVTGAFYAGSACTADGSNCFVPLYAASTQPLKAISYDAINAGRGFIRSSLTLSGLAGTLADCTGNGAVGCVTTTTFKSADLTNLLAENIKKNVTIAGTVGDYPSAANPLTGSDTTADLDLTTFDAKIRNAANFEWFDQSGTRYLNAGDPDIAEGNIKSGTTIFGVTGNMTLPPSGRVLTGTSFGVGGTSLTGGLTLPAAAHVLTGTGLFGDPTAALTPTLSLPAAGKVLSGTTYGVGGNGSSGTLTLPLASDVISGSAPYGDPDSPRTPSYTNPFPPLIVRPVAPTITGVSFNFTPDRVTLNWDAVTGASGYIVLMNQSQTVSWAPTDRVTYSTGTYGSDTMIHSGTDTSVTYNTAVTAGTTFYFAIYSYETNRIYSYAPTTRTMLSCAGLMGGTWIPVPGDPIYGTNGFCVQKYIPPNVGGVPTSQTGTLPWVTSQGLARSACSGLGVGYHLITNPEWMTIAANIANTGSNWSGGSVGSGALAQGHSDSSPNSSCAADPDDTKGWVQDSCAGQTQGAMSWSQKRTRILSNNYVIWDIGGNLWQAIDYNNLSDRPAGNNNNWFEYPSVIGTATTPKSHLVPLNSVQPWWSDSWNSSQGIGRFFPGYHYEYGDLSRGGHWNGNSISGPFAAGLSAFGVDWSATGLRCAWQP
jgi:hypothetical protein